MATIALFLKWCVNRWPKVPLPTTLVQRKSIKICTKNLPRSKLLKLKCKSNHRQTHLAQAWFHQLRTKKLKEDTKTGTQVEILARSLVEVLNNRNEMMPLIGEWVILTTMTITWMNKLRSRRTKVICFSASSRSRRSPWASTLPEERKRKVVKSLLPVVVATSKALAVQSWTMLTHRSMISDTDSNADQIF